MTKEEDIKQDLVKKFNIQDDKIHIVRDRRISLTIDQSSFNKVLEYIYKELQFVYLCMITGLDEGESLSFIYELSQSNGAMLSLKTSVPKANPVLKTVTPYFSCADAYERELIDLLGAQVEGLPAGHRYPLTDDWPQGQFPLRKDWTPDLLK